MTKKAPRFNRIRRITGYLTGTVDRWNDGKQAELKSRVKHTLNEELANKNDKN